LTLKQQCIHAGQQATAIWSLGGGLSVSHPIKLAIEVLWNKVPSGTEKRDEKIATKTNIFGYR
jgi:hypothetical protein